MRHLEAVAAAHCGGCEDCVRGAREAEEAVAAAALEESEEEEEGEEAAPARAVGSQGSVTQREQAAAAATSGAAAARPGSASRKQQLSPAARQRILEGQRLNRERRFAEAAAAFTAAITALDGAAAPESLLRKRSYSLAQLGRLDEALEDARGALAAASRDGVARSECSAHLASVLYKMGRLDEAQRAMQEAAASATGRERAEYEAKAAQLRRAVRARGDDRASGPAPKRARPSPGE